MSDHSSAKNATLRIERLGHRGDGVAEGPVYVERTLPGEVVTGTIDGERLQQPRIVTPSPDRVAAPCPHYRRCGGCSLQHASDGFVAAWKVGVVRDVLSRAGLDVDVVGVETSPPGSRRRAALSGRKTRKGAEVGFHVRGSDQIVAVPDCQVLHPDLIASLPVLEQVTRIATTRGAAVTLHVTQGPAGVDLAIEGARPLDREAAVALTTFATAFARITWNGEPALQQAAPYQVFGTAHVVPPPGAFLQATPQGEAALVGHVCDTLGGAQRVVDLFAGAGTFTFPAARTAAVHAVEGERSLIAALQDGVRQIQGLKPITAAVRDLFREPLQPSELAQFDGAIIDPPRAGAAAQVAELAQSDLQKIAFVSCNPGTFARDAATLTSAGWRMGAVTVVDQFRWSAHIELVTSFEKP